MTPIRSHKFLGIGLVLIGALGLSIQNVILRLFFAPSLLLGQITFGGWVSPQLSNVVMLLALRMAIMALLLTGLTPWLYPQAFSVLWALPTTPRLFGFVTASGVCLFLGLTLLYVALSQLAAGLAIATFFIYPAITLLLAWYFFRQRPHLYQLGLMGIIFVGVVLTTLTSSIDLTSNPILGGVSAMGAGLSFGVYGIFAELSLQPQPSSRPIHPLPFSLYTFVVVAICASLTLMVSQQVMVAAAAWLPVLAMTLLSATLTLVAYVLNNFGIRYIGASLTGLISSSTPAFTALFAWWILQEILNFQQILGIGLISMGVATLSIKSRH